MTFGARTVGATLGLLLTSTITLQAHHGFTGRYALSEPVWLEGVVAKAYFGQPHAEVTVRTPTAMSAPEEELDLAGARDTIDPRRLMVRADTRGKDIEVEFPPITRFFALRRSVAVGDRVAIIAFRNCAAPHQLRGQWIRAEGMAPVARPGRVSYQVDRC